MKATTVVTPEEIHLGLYKRGPEESRGEAQIAPHKLVLSDEAVTAEVNQLVGMVEFVFQQNENNHTEDKIELQCTTTEVEKALRKKLGKKKVRSVKFLPAKVQEIRGQYQYGQ